VRASPLLLLLFLASSACSRTVYEAHFAPPTQLVKLAGPASRAPFIKCHMPDGSVFVLQQWSIEEGTGLVDGFGIEYDADRNPKAQPRRQSLKFDDIALIETNRPYTVDVGLGPVIALGIGTAVSVAVSAVCLTQHLCLPQTAKVP
jgi:hypothetical protein